jgi:DNA-binding PadR family transcriptional regulator
MHEGMMDFPNWRFASGGKGRGRHRPSPEDLERFAALRHVRGGGFGGPPFGGGRGRRRRGDVRTALLLLLAEEPRNGYQLMQEIEERSDGRWRPSPGSVYPSLSQLEDEGLIRATELDGQKAFEITDTGREHLAERGEQAPPWDDGDDEHPSKDLRGLIGGVAEATMLVAKRGSEEQVGRAVAVLKEARRQLYKILAEDEDE